jgi:hypothetical protein
MTEEELRHDEHLARAGGERAANPEGVVFPILIEHLENLRSELQEVRESDRAMVMFSRYALPDLSLELREQEGACGVRRESLVDLSGKRSGTRHDFTTTYRRLCLCPRCGVLSLETETVDSHRTTGHHFREDTRVDSQLLTKIEAAALLAEDE